MPSGIQGAIPHSTIIDTPRCILRRVTRDDIPFIFSATRYPGFCDGMCWNPPETEDELLIPFKKNLGLWDEGKAYTFTIQRKEGGERIGRIAIRFQEPGVWDLGFWTHPVFQGKGYMTEAARALLGFGFETLEATRIEAAHALWNIASRSVLQKIGMRFVRHLPEGFMKNGAWVPEDLFVITASEWGETTTRDGEIAD